MLNILWVYDSQVFFWHFREWVDSAGIICGIFIFLINWQWLLLILKEFVWYARFFIFTIWLCSMNTSLFGLSMLKYFSNLHGPRPFFCSCCAPIARKLTIYFLDTFSQEIQALVDCAVALSWTLWGVHLPT